jgi:hypothetical protein
MNLKLYFMDFTFLPRTIFKNRVFVRYTKSAIPVYQAPEKELVIRDGFYYIGKNAGSIDKLVKVFNRGYASQMLDDAKFELERVLAQDKNTIPEIIFCEGDFDAARTREFAEFLKGHPTLSSVPFVVNAENLSEQALSTLKKTK